MTLAYEDEIDDDIYELGEQAHKDGAAALIGVLAAGYVKGQAAAAYELGHSAAGLKLSASDIAYLQQKVKEILDPIADYNMALAQALKLKTDEMIAQGMTTEEIKSYYLNNIPNLIKELPVKIQRPGKQAITFTPESYAKNLANTIPYAIRNEGWRKKMKDEGKDKWMSACWVDALTCDDCMDICGDYFDMDEPMPPYHSHCRCKPILPEDQEGGLTGNEGPAYGEE